MQWNLGTHGSLWIVKPDSVNQIGCIHTCQGLELDYDGCDHRPRHASGTRRIDYGPNSQVQNDRSIFGWKKQMKTDPEATLKKLDSIIRNTYRTLMTRE